MRHPETMALLQSALAEVARREPGFRVFVLTGAGVSRESGIATFRDAGGLWERYPIEQVATPQGYRRNPALVHEFYSLRRQETIAVQPNAAHEALCRLEAHLGERLTLVTQNIDDLHERAGSRRLIHMHGEVRKLRCVGAGHVFDWSEDAYCGTQCPECYASVRPHVVWFGEMPLEMDRIRGALAEAEVFCAIGTSGKVYPAAGFVSEANSHGALCIEVNPQETGGPFDLRLVGPATEQVPLLVDALTGV